jgi:hypothetical protein
MNSLHELSPLRDRRILDSKVRNSTCHLGKHGTNLFTTMEHMLRYVKVANRCEL